MAKKKLSSSSRKKLKRSQKISPKSKSSSKKIKKAQLKSKTDFLKDTEMYDFLHNIVGAEGIQVIKKIAEKELSDVDLAETMELKPNLIRKHLYALYEAGIVTYRRHRSKTGWYTYFWKLHPDRINAAIGIQKGKEQKKLKELLDFEINNHFYECKNKCGRIIFNEATETEFKCTKCSESLEFSENKERVEELQKRLEFINSAKSQNIAS